MGFLNKGMFDMFNLSEWQQNLPPSFNTLFHRPVQKLGLDSFLALKFSLDACILLCFMARQWLLHLFYIQ